MAERAGPGVESDGSVDDGDGGGGEGERGGGRGGDIDGVGVEIAVGDEGTKRTTGVLEAGGRGVIREVGGILGEGDVSREELLTKNGVKATVAFLSGRVYQKDTLGGARGELISGGRWGMHEGSAPKDSERERERLLAWIQNGELGFPMKNGGGNAIDEITGKENIIAPIGARNMHLGH
ncbi:hypothetical protein KSP39_PZI009178 [Platanthera zijinensis]|uniref:Uncharacterized protein n=1 Tax=Platanthera zijinensis TaxID=2320716 RepID=A0AAP0BK62_9ASPA